MVRYKAYWFDRRGGGIVLRRTKDGKTLAFLAAQGLETMRHAELRRIIRNCFKEQDA